MASAVLSLLLIQRALASLQDGIHGLSVHLFTNNITPTPATLESAFVEAAYDTYPSGGITPPMPSVVQVGNEYQWTSIGVNFPAPTASGPVNIYGFWIHGYPTGLPGYLLLSARFPAAPIVLVNGGASLPLVIDLKDFDVNNP